MAEDETAAKNTDNTTTKAVQNGISESEKSQPIKTENNETSAATPWKKMSVKEKYKYFLSNITVEPMLAGYAVATILASMATANLNIEKACRVNLNYGDEICTALAKRQTANYTVEEKTVQKLVANMSAWTSIISSAIPAILIMFFGSWSDRWGRRKPFMLLPMIGSMLTSFGLLVCTFFFYELPMEVAGLVESVFPAITGGWFTKVMAVYCYIGDIATEDMKTVRIGFVNIVSSVAVPFAMALSGILYAKIGFYGVFGITSMMKVAAILYGIFRIKEAKKPPPIKPGEKDDKCCFFWRDLFDFTNIKQTILVTFKSGAKQRRTKIILLMLVVCIVIGPMHGEHVIMYISLRYRFNWNEIDYSIFSTYCIVLNLIGSAVAVGLLSHVMKVDDAMIGILACVSKIICEIFYGLAKSTWLLYFAPVIGILRGTPFIALRSITTKLVPAEELGQVNSIIGLCEALMPFIYGPLFSEVYSATIDVLPGAFFLLGAILTTPSIFIFYWFYRVSRKEKREAKKKAEEERKKNEEKEKMEEEEEETGIENTAYLQDSVVVS